MSAVADPNAQMGEIVQQYQSMREEIKQMMTKLAELDSSRNESMLVIKTLSKTDPKRKCFRSIGGVLVEGTVETVLPAVQSNLELLENAIQGLRGQATDKQTKAEEFRKKYNIRSVEEYRAQKQSSPPQPAADA